MKGGYTSYGENSDAMWIHHRLGFSSTEGATTSHLPFFDSTWGQRGEGEIKLELSSANF